VAGHPHGLTVLWSLRNSTTSNMGSASLYVMTRRPLCLKPPAGPPDEDSAIFASREITGTPVPSGSDERRIWHADPTGKKMIAHFQVRLLSLSQDWKPPAQTDRIISGCCAQPIPFDRCFTPNELTRGRRRRQPGLGRDNAAEVWTCPTDNRCAWQPGTAWEHAPGCLHSRAGRTTGAGLRPRPHPPAQTGC
jgi:hypothetical protein